MPAAQRAREPEPLASNPMKHVGASVGPLIARAERYGLAVQCAGQASYALSQAEAGRPLAGAPEADALKALKADHDMRAAQLALQVKRTSAETAQAVKAAAAASAGAASLGCLAAPGP